MVEPPTALADGGGDHQLVARALSARRYGPVLSLRENQLGLC
jgi:hypothetical protein